MGIAKAGGKIAGIDVNLNISREIITRKKNLSGKKKIKRSS